MSKHTPGPWEVNFKKFNEVRAENGAVVAECKKLTSLVGLQANARLIAAAPNLLEALQGLLNALPSATTHPAIRAARAAIAKATGDES